MNDTQSLLPQSLPTQSTTAATQSTTVRRVEIAKNVARVAVITLVATTLIFGTLACLLFIPAAPLFGIGTAILLAFAGKVAGTAALATSILLPAAFIITPTVTAATTAAALAAQKNSDSPLLQKILGIV